MGRCRLRGSGGGDKACVCQEEEERESETQNMITRNMSSKKKTAGDDSEERKSREKLDNRGEIKGKKRVIEVGGVTHTWKMVFWSPTTSPSPTVRVS